VYVLLEYMLSLIILRFPLFLGIMAHMTMNKRKKKGISMVLTTLIIVIASVVLATAMSLFGTSLFQTGAQQQGLEISNVHIWQGQNSTTNTLDVAAGALVVRNTGDRITGIDSIMVRGASVPFGSWYASSAADSTWGNFQKSFKYLVNPDTELDIDKDGNADLSAGGLVKQDAPVVLDPGAGVIIYFVLPGSNDTDLTNDPIGRSDVGTSTSVSVFAGTVGQVQIVTVARTPF